MSAFSSGPADALWFAVGLLLGICGLPHARAASMGVQTRAGRLAVSLSWLASLTPGDPLPSAGIAALPSAGATPP